MCNRRSSQNDNNVGLRGHTTPFFTILVEPRHSKPVQNHWDAMNVDKMGKTTKTIKRMRMLQFNDVD
eukprot:1560734-Amphidinium_carterae.1